MNLKSVRLGVAALCCVSLFASLDASAVEKIVVPSGQARPSRQEIVLKRAAPALSAADKALTVCKEYTEAYAAYVQLFPVCVASEKASIAGLVRGGYAGKQTEYKKYPYKSESNDPMPCLIDPICDMSDRSEYYCDGKIEASLHVIDKGRACNLARLAAARACDGFVADLKAKDADLAAKKKAVVDLQKGIDELQKQIDAAKLLKPIMVQDQSDSATAWGKAIGKLSPGGCSVPSGLLNSLY